LTGYRGAQEDQHTIKLATTPKERSFFGVYDGHGGKAAAQYLAAKLCDRLTNLQRQKQLDAEQSVITQCLLQLDHEFFKQCPDETSGSCIVFALVEDATGHVLVGNLGDSRALLIHADGTYVTLTNDHKPFASAESERIDKAGGFVSGGRVKGDLAISRAFGDKHFKSNSELSAEKQMVCLFRFYSA
jgi:serine/threonine protein phosphatase PrpC